MKINFILNGRSRTAEVKPDASLYTLLRDQKCYSVKCGCDTSNCGLCTVMLNGKPVLSCSVPAVRISGQEIITLEGLQKEAEEFGRFMAAEGADQCGFCNPGFIMNVLAMMNELDDPTEEDVRQFLAGNLCRCTGYEAQHRALTAYMKAKKGGNETGKGGDL